MLDDHVLDALEVPRKAHRALSPIAGDASEGDYSFEVGTSGIKAGADGACEVILGTEEQDPSGLVADRFARHGSVCGDATGHVEGESAFSLAGVAFEHGQLALGESPRP